MRIHWPSVRVLFLAGPALAVALAGCASPDVNPAAPKARTGYLDLYTGDPAPVSWKVQDLVPGTQKFHDVFTQIDPIDTPVIRLAFPPGRRQFKVNFLNCPVVEPAAFEVTIEAGRVTPVQVSRISIGTTLVETRELDTGPTYKGRYGTTKKFGIDPSQLWRLTAAPQALRDYSIKENMPYYSRAQNQ